MTDLLIESILGRYRIGDVVISSDTNVDSSVIARALVCVSGESSEIVEAPSYAAVKTAGTAAFFREFKSIDVGSKYTRLNLRVILTFFSQTLRSFWDRSPCHCQLG